MLRQPEPAGPAKGLQSASSQAATRPLVRAPLVSAVVDREKIFREIEARIDRFPSLPTVVAEIERVASDPGSSLGDFEAAIRKDQAITAKILRLTNSAFYARSRPVTTIPDAVVTLGAKSLKSLVLAAATSKLLERRLDGYGYAQNGLWKHSFATALCARAAARRINASAQLGEEVFVAGLLHDIGKIVLDPLLSERHVGGADPATLAVENERVGWDHTRVGEMIATKWKLPPQIAEVIVHHHDPMSARAFPQHVAVLALANALVKEAGIGLSAPQAGAAHPAVPLDAAAALAVREAVSEQMAEARAACEQLAGA